MKKNQNKGFSLVELIVTVAIMGLVATFLVSSYTDQMREQRHQADTATLTEIDTQLKLLFTYDDVWEEVQKNVIGDDPDKKDTLVIQFPCTPTSKAGEFILRNATVNNATFTMESQLPVLYGHLRDTFGQSIKMSSSDHISGTYVVTCKFPGNQLSSVRGWTLSNESVIIKSEQIWNS